MIALEDIELREAGGLVAALGRLGDRWTSKLADAWSTLTETWRGGVPVRPLAEEIQRGNIPAAQQLATAPIIATDPGELIAIQRRLYGTTAQEAAYLGAGELTARAGAPLRGAVLALRPALRERAVLWLAEQPAPGLVETSEATREIVRQIVGAGLAEDRAPAQIAAAIRNVVGLSPPQAAAVQALRARLEAAGELGAREIDRAIRNYANQLLTLRAQTIATTETARAIGAGADRVWQEAGEQGLVDLATVTKTWRTMLDDKVRPEHAEMEGETVAYDENFDFYGEHVKHPPHGINCRCFPEYST